MPKLTYNTAAGDLTIGGVAMNGPAWKVLNLYELWQPANVRGSDRIIPGATGVLAYRRRVTVTVRSLQMLISGTHDRTGAAAADRYEGLQTNVEYLVDNVVDPVGSGDGTRSAVLTMPDGSTYTEPVHVLGLELGDVSLDGSWAKAVIELSIPSGRFS
jgi:hypothetical protein